MKAISFACLLIFGLSACSGGSKSSCSEPKTVILGEKPSLEQLEDSVYSCIHWQAKLLSGGSGATEQIADSVIYGCKGRILNWRGTIENSKGEYAVAAIGDAYFDPTIADFRKSAIYRVTEARAGKCYSK